MLNLGIKIWTTNIAAGTPAPPPVVNTIDFTGTNGTPISAYTDGTYTFTRGASTGTEATIQNNELDLALDGNERILLDDVTISNGYIEIDITEVPTTGAVGVLFRMSGALGSENGYYARVNFSLLRLQIYRVTNGALSLIGQQGPITLVSGPMRVAFQGDQIDLTYSGETLSTTDATYQSGLIGVRHFESSSNIDNFAFSGAAATGITALSVDGVQTSGNLPMSINVSEDSLINWGFGPGATPTAAELAAGTGMTAFGQINVLTANPILAITIPNDLDVTGQNFWANIEGTNLVVTATGSVPFAIDTTQPSGTITAAPTGEATADVIVDVANEAGDIIDVALYLNTISPSDDDIRTGTGAAWASQGNVAAAGVNLFAATGLSKGLLYRAYAIITDGQDQFIRILSGTFRTAGIGVDTFTAPDNTNLQNYVGESQIGWVDQGTVPSPIIIDNQVVNASTATTYWSRDDAATTDQRVTADFVFRNTGTINSVAITARTTPGQNCYGVRWDVSSSQWQLFKVVNNSFTPIGTGSTDAGAVAGVTRRVALEVVGTTLTVFVDGVQILSETDTQFASGKGGVRLFNESLGLRIDNFDFEDLT